MISTIAAQEAALGMIPSHDQHHRSPRSCSWDDSFTWSAPSQPKELLLGWLLHMISTISAQGAALGMIPSHGQHHRSTRSCYRDDSWFPGNCLTLTSKNRLRKNASNKELCNTGFLLFSTLCSLTCSHLTLLDFCCSGLLCSSACPDQCLTFYQWIFLY